MSIDVPRPHRLAALQTSASPRAPLHQSVPIAAPNVRLAPWHVQGQPDGARLSLVVGLTVGPDGQVRNLRLLSRSSDHPDFDFVAEWVAHSLAQSEDWRLPPSVQGSEAVLVIERQVGRAPRIELFAGRQHLAQR